jgi:hypothetical protein
MRKVGADRYQCVVGVGPPNPDDDEIHYKTKATGETPAQAMVKAAGIAQKVAENPVISALLPPQAKLALQATMLIGQSAAAGKAANAIAKFSGPGVSRLMRALF